MIVTFTTPVKDLFQDGLLSARSYNTCVANGINIVRDLDLLHHPKKGFRLLRSCGIKTNQELEGILDALVTLPQEVSARSYVESLPVVVVEALRKSLSSVFPHDSSDEESKLFYYLFNEDLFIFLLYRVKEDILLHVDSDIPASVMVNPDTVVRYRVRRKMVNVITKALEEIVFNYDPEVRRERSQLKKLRQSLDLSLSTRFVEAYYKALLSDKKMEMAEKEYKLLTSQAPRIIQNFIRKKGFGFENCWSLLNASDEDFVRFYPTCRRSALGYLEILKVFREYIERLAISSQEEDNKSEFLNLFTFLTPHEADLSLSFMKEHGHYPMFFITDRYFATTEVKQHKIYARCFGLGGIEAKRKTDVADELGMSRERVRQIITDSDFSRFAFADKSLWVDYPFGNVHFMSSKSGQWEKEMSREGVSPEFTAFAGVMVAVYGYSYKRLAGVDKFLVDSRYLSTYGAYLRKMLDQRDRSHADNKIIPLREFMSADDYADERILHNVKRELTAYLEIEMIGDNLYFPHNKIDVAAEVEKMLRKDGNPIHIDEILERMNASFPDLELTRDRLKFQMRSSDEIVPRGRSSFYCLRSWTHVFIGSIRDLVKQTLSSSKDPLDMEQIMMSVNEHFDTTRYNVYNSLLVSPDFVLYEGKRFGLAGRDYGETEKATNKVK